MIGLNDAECLFSIYEDWIDPNVFNVYNANPHIMIPKAWNVSEGSPLSESMIKNISEFYFNGQPLSGDVKYPYTQVCMDDDHFEQKILLTFYSISQYNTDLMFARGIDRTAKLHAKIQDEPVYYYKFSFTGALNLVKDLLLLLNYPGAVHGDEVPYLFQITSLPTPLFPDNPAIRTRQLMVRLWTNFAKTG